MLISGAVPNELVPVVERLLTNSIPGLRKEVDVAELYFADASWLGLSDDQLTLRWKKEHVLDGMRKVELSGRARSRRCARCCAVIEDLLPARGVSNFLLNFQRVCFCGGSWVVGMGSREETGLRQS